jgi:hypothetical protein
MALVEDEGAVEAFGSDGPNESRRGIGSACPPGCAKNSDPVCLEDLIEDGATALVSVVDRELDRCVPSFPRLGKVAGDLSALGEIGGATSHAADDPRRCAELIRAAAHPVVLHAGRLSGELRQVRMRCRFAPPAVIANRFWCGRRMSGYDRDQHTRLAAPSPSRRRRARGCL